MKNSIVFLAVSAALVSGAASAASVHSHAAEAGKKAFHGYANFQRAQAGEFGTDAQAAAARVIAKYSQDHALDGFKQETTVRVLPAPAPASTLTAEQAKAIEAQISAMVANHVSTADAQKVADGYAARGLSEVAGLISKSFPGVTAAQTSAFGTQIQGQIDPNTVNPNSQPVMNGQAYSYGTPATTNPAPSIKITGTPAIKPLTGTAPAQLNGYQAPTNVQGAYAPDPNKQVAVPNMANGQPGQIALNVATAPACQPLPELVTARTRLSPAARP